MLVALIPELPKAVVDWATIILAAAAIVAAFVVGWIFYRLSRKDSQKALTYDFTTAKIVTADHPFKGELKLFYSGTEIEDASLVSVTIRSAGGSSIEKVDFEEPLRVNFVGADAVLAVQLAEAIPPELKPLFRNSPDDQIKNETILIDPLLLNSGDQFALLALVSGFNGEVLVIGRIKGVSSIVRVKPYETLNSAAKLATSIAGAAGPSWLKMAAEIATRLIAK